MSWASCSTSSSVCRFFSGSSSCGRRLVGPEGLAADVVGLAPAMDAMRNGGEERETKREKGKGGENPGRKQRQGTLFVLLNKWAVLHVWLYKRLSCALLLSQKRICFFLFLFDFFFLIVKGRINSSVCFFNLNWFMMDVFIHKKFCDSYRNLWLLIYWSHCSSFYWNLTQISGLGP